MPSIFLRFPGGRARALTLSYDDGVEQDIRLIGIMRAHGLKGTFNLNSGLIAPEDKVWPEGQVHRRMKLSQMEKLYTEAGMEVAVHGLTHPFLEQLPQGALARELVQDRENLERIYGGVVRGMAYPFGTWNERVLEALRAADIAYARTVVSTHGFALPEDWLRLDPTCHHADPELMELADRFLSAPDDRAPLLFYLWGHSYEFERDDNWQVIEDFAARLGGRDDVWYATNMEIYDYVQAFRRLEFSADGRVFRNLSALELCLATSEGEALTIAPGETRAL